MRTFVSRRTAIVLREYAHALAILQEFAWDTRRKPAPGTATQPASLGGSPVVLQLRVENLDVAFERMRAAGATVVFPIVEFCGDRLARLRDPYGHLWLLAQPIEELSPAEIQRRRDAWAPPGQPAKR
jgi:PhnB protein